MNELVWIALAVLVPGALVVLLAYCFNFAAFNGWPEGSRGLWDHRR